jgi:hypothetical protein
LLAFIFVVYPATKLKDHQKLTVLLCYKSLMFAIPLSWMQQEKGDERTLSGKLCWKKMAIGYGDIEGWVFCQMISCRFSPHLPN